MGIDDSGDWLAPSTDRYVDVSCETLVIAHVVDTLAQLQRWPAEPIRLFFAARSLHSAIVAALTTALAGTDGTGAFSEKTRLEWLAHFESSRQGLETPDLSDRVLSFRDLMSKAREEGGGWLSDPVTVTDEEYELLERLTQLRDLAEHPKPGLGAFEPAYILACFPIGIRMAETFFSAVQHRLDALEDLTYSKAVAALKVQAELMIEKSRAEDA